MENAVIPAILCIKVQQQFALLGLSALTFFPCELQHIVLALIGNVSAYLAKNTYSLGFRSVEVFTSS